MAPLVGPVPLDTIIALAIGLPVRDPQGLKAFIKQVSDPKSAIFREHLTQAQFNSTYGATSSDYQALQNWATSNGFTIDATFPNNLLLGVNPTAAQIEHALYANLVYRRRTDGSKFVSVDREPSLDLTVPILEINGLTDFRTPQSATVHGTGGSNGNAYRAADLRNAYLGVGSDLQSLDGAGQVIGIVGWDVFNLSDITGYCSLQLPASGQPKLQSPPDVTIVATEGGNPISTGKIEATLDVEMVLAMAPNAKVLFFQGSTGITCNLSKILHKMANSSPPLTVASSSVDCYGPWGQGQGNSQQALGQMAAQGVSFFRASGDCGDVGDPQSDLDLDYQTLVGGTFLATRAITISVLDPPVYPSDYYKCESIWTEVNSDGILCATGGGIMNGEPCICIPYPFCCGGGVPIPVYQIGIMEAPGIAPANGGSTTSRNYPDVAMVASNIEIYFNGAIDSGQMGTSFAAPLWAGFMALVNQRTKKINPNAGLPGFLNQTLYDIGMTSGLTEDIYAQCFNDIIGGTNKTGDGGFNCVKGYDLCTGWGTPKPGLVYQLSSPHPLTGDQPLEQIRLVIGTGHDNLRGNGSLGCRGTGCTADILFPGYDLTTGVGVVTVTLKPIGGDGEFAKNSTTGQIDNPIPKKDKAGNAIQIPTPSHGIMGVRINIQQDYSPPCGPDNWDIYSLRVTLFTTGFPEVCQLNLVGNAKRLAKNRCQQVKGLGDGFYEDV